MSGAFSIRRSFGKIKQAIEASNLVEVQKSSYSSFLQAECDPNKRKDEGLQAIFQELFPIKDNGGKAQVEFCSYVLEKSKMNEDEAKRRDVTYSSPLKVKLRLILWEGKGAERTVRQIKEQDVYFGDIPLMTESGTFVINGSPRVIVSQMHKSAGVLFDWDRSKTQISKKLYSAHVVPYRGAWLDFEFDSKDLIYVRIDKKKKVLLSTFLMLLEGEGESVENKRRGVKGMSKQEILNACYESIKYKKCKFGWELDYKEEMWKGQKVSHDILNPSNGEVIVEAGDKANFRKLKIMAELGKIAVGSEFLVGLYVSKETIIGEEKILSVGEEITSEHLNGLLSLGEVDCLDIDNVRVGGYLRDTLLADKNNSREEALINFYRILRPGEPISVEGAQALFHSLFFDPERYDISPVGRVKMNSRLKDWFASEPDKESRVLSKNDILAIVKALLALRDGRGDVDDVDHLGNRRVRSVGELVANQYRSAMLKVGRSIKERLSAIEVGEDVELHDLINSRSLVSSIREFFGVSQLSQLMDQVNPLSELSHKRRLSALGPGGLDGMRASFEVRDVHPTHYGRICAIASPEGQNIGLINYLARYAKIDKYGFIQTPYKPVKNGVVQDSVIYMNASEEWENAIASSIVKTGENGEILDEMVACRKAGDYFLLPPKEVDYIDIASGQILSVAASLIPFVENDDPGRALMGSNMQRQAVPLQNPEAPLVGTGMEEQVAIDSMAVISAKYDGIVKQVDSSRVVIQRLCEKTRIDVYRLRKFEKSNANTSINHKVLVSVGDKVSKGDLIADGPSTQNGELALGQNIRVAFLPYKWCFEDSVVISERLLKNKLTSIHIEEFEVSIRDTKLGSEDITRDIPLVSEEALRNLDEAGIVYLGAQIKAGDILVGRVTPKIETPSSPEERLLKAMFGERATDVSDSSLRVPSGVSGTVIDVQIFSKKGMEKDERSLLIERTEIQRLTRDRDAEIVSVLWNYKSLVDSFLLDQIILEDGHIFAKDTQLTKSLLESCNINELFGLKVEKHQEEIIQIEKEIKDLKKQINARFEKAVKEVQAGDDLPPGVLKTVKVFVAMHRTIQEGDKVAGRHGNKGVISKILPVADMPFDEKGRPVDMILNPLGVPARMNIGQILETHLGWVSATIGENISKMLGNLYNSKATFEDLKQMLQKVYPDQPEIKDFSEEEMLNLAVKISKGLPFSSPAFDGAKIEDIKQLLRSWGLPESGQIRLRDGTNGQDFPHPVTVGIIYTNKLNHMVVDKMHARSTGSYSLVTQQPPGGKAKKGGQRKGEMEIWALEAYGAAYITREAMTIKSDDHMGRIATYEAITQGAEITNDNHYTPEAFKILQSEMKCIGINLECVSKASADDDWEVVQKNSSFEALRISLVSPEEVRKSSFGEVTKSETINYRTVKPEIDGLFCPCIFGPVKDYECACGRYRRMKHRGVICEKCHVEVTLSRVRRERMGHIELASPVAHIWFTKILPSRIGMVLDLSSKDLDRILRFEKYVVTKPGISHFSVGNLLSEEEYSAAKKEYGFDAFEADMGPEALQTMLKNINLEEEFSKLLLELENKPQELKRKKIIKRLKLIEGFIKTKTRPEWMIMDVIPVMPADLRPLVALDAGRFATADVNELYRKVINRNNRLKELMSLKFPKIVINNEKRMLQEAVYALFDNGRLKRPMTATNKKVLQSIGDVLKGKQGRFRQNLLGKRVDYSGRSVIVVGPELKIHQCGLPKKMALELFKPFVYARLEQYGIATTLKSAKRIVEEERPEIWGILSEVVHHHPVLLNRAPTLHRLGIQAFECVLIDGSAIQLHPLVCASFNADFDGDQMSVHVPLSVEAQLEARVLMMPTNNMLSPANGKPIMVPTKDIVLGIYYMTLMRKGLPGEGLIFRQSEIEFAVFDKILDVNSCIEVFLECAHEGYKKFQTSAGRVILYNSLPKGHKVPFSFVNRVLANKDISALFALVYKTSPRQDAVEFADVLMQLGFKYAAYSGVSFSHSDLISPPGKKEIIESTWEIIRECNKQFQEGLITEGERRNKVTDAWFQCDEKVGASMEKAISEEIPGKPMNSVYMMASSGARGSPAQMRQVMAMRGFIAKTDGEILENAVDRNYSEGLDPHSYYLATHGTRKGFSDMALKTADAGYFTRRLVDVAQDCIITSQDCLTKDSITYEARSGVDTSAFSEAFGRVIAEDVLDPANDSVILKKNSILDEENVTKLDNAGVLNIRIRSPISCSNDFGICSMCYGMDLSKGALVNVGEPVGIVAAQSIGEPGAQLTMRTFHSGGGARRTSDDYFINAVCNGTIKFRNVKTVEKQDGISTMLSRYGEFTIVDDFGRERSELRIPYGSSVFVKDGQSIKKGDRICEWDPYIIPVLSEVDGFVHYVDLVEGVSLKAVVDEASGFTSRIVSDWRKGNKKDGLSPAITFKTKEGHPILSADGAELFYKLMPEDVLVIENGSPIKQGDLLIKRQKEALLSGDITAGLPRLVELFEARLPKIQAVISEVDGIVSIGKDYRSRRCVIVSSEDGDREYMIPKDKHILAQPGDPIRKGDPICDGDISSHDILAVLGKEAVVLHLLKMIQIVFKAQGIGVDNKHIECIIRHMMRKVEIVDAGDSAYVIGEQVDCNEFFHSIKKLAEAGKALPSSRPVLQGITRAASMDPSFIKAASFQEAHKVFVDAALTGRVDNLNGMKQRLITGLLIPTGTGFIPSYWAKSENAQKYDESSYPIVL